MYSSQYLHIYDMYKASCYSRLCKAERVSSFLPYVVITAQSHERSLGPTADTVYTYKHQSTFTKSFHS